MVKGSTHEEVIGILTVDTPINKAVNYMTQKLIKLREEIDKSTLTVEDLNNSLSTITRTTRENISKDIELKQTSINGS